MLTIIYMAPGGHRQWPMSISALLDRLSWLVLQTRTFSFCLTSKQPCRRIPSGGPDTVVDQRLAVAPPTPFKFPDIGTKMGCYKIGDHIPARKDTTNIFHPRFVGEGIPSVNTFHAVMHERAAKWFQMVKCGV